MWTMNFPAVTSRRMAGVITPGLSCKVENEKQKLSSRGFRFHLDPKPF